MAELKTPSVPALERALTILEMLATSRKGFTLAQLARNLGLPKSSTHCLLLTLERRGYLQLQHQTAQYIFGMKLFSLANMTLAGIHLREQAAPLLNVLMKRTRLTVHMAILERDEPVLVEKIKPPGLMQLATWIGKRMDAHCTGVGKVLMAAWPEEEIDRWIKEHHLTRHNENTLASAKKLKEQLAEVRTLGYAVDDEEDEIGLRCIGAPLFDHSGKVAAAISVSGTTSQITPENLTSLVKIVKEVASAISGQLGFQAAS